MSCSSPASDSSRRSGIVGIIVPEKLWTSLIIVYFCFFLRGQPFSFADFSIAKLE